MKKSLKGLGIRCEVSMFSPSKELLDIAEERTDGIVSYYIEVSRNRSNDFITRLKDLDTLAQSCYMQGVNDVLKVIEGMKKV